MELANNPTFSIELKRKNQVIQRLSTNNSMKLNPSNPPIKPAFRSSSRSLNRTATGALVQHLPAASLTLSDLPSSEKAKVARLVDRLVSLAKEHEDLLQLLATERSQRTDDIEFIQKMHEDEIEQMGRQSNSSREQKWV